MQLLHDLIGDLQRQRELIDERLRLAAELLNTYDPTDADDNDLALGDEEVTFIPSKPAKKPKPSTERVACPDCGEMFHKQGIGPHRATKHAGSAAKPLHAVPRSPGHRDPSDDFGEEFFACSTCNHEEPNVNGLKRHTLMAHGRPVNDTEREAIPA